MNMKILMLGWLIALAAAFSAAAADRAATPEFKGMELYSWKPAGKDWHFSLLIGTNRLKTDEEIRKPEQTIVGVKELKKRLAKLAEGENVAWRNLAKEPFPQELARALKTFCDGIKVTLDRADAGIPDPGGHPGDS